jgi:hypothetical protein
MNEYNVLHLEEVYSAVDEEVWSWRKLWIEEVYNTEVDKRLLEKVKEETKLKNFL